MAANTYEEWIAAAVKLDALEGADGWKDNETSGYYDSKHIAERLVEMERVGILCQNPLREASATGLEFQL